MVEVEGLGRQHAYCEYPVTERTWTSAERRRLEASDGQSLLGCCVGSFNFVAGYNGCRRSENLRCQPAQQLRARRATLGYKGIQNGAVVLHKGHGLRICCHQYTLGSEAGGLESM